MWFFAQFGIVQKHRNLVPFVQFKKREKHPFRSAAFSKVASNTLPWVFFAFFKLYK